MRKKKGPDIVKLSWSNNANTNYISFPLLLFELVMNLKNFTIVVTKFFMPSSNYEVKSLTSFKSNNEHFAPHDDLLSLLCYFGCFVCFKRYT